MQPLFTHNVLALGVLSISLLIWRVMETWVDIKTHHRLRTGIQRHDQGSYMLILCLMVFGILLGVLAAFKVPGTAITSANMFFFWLGILLIYAGIVLRFYAITVLGAFFTTKVAVATEQPVIEAGPYRLIRHPAYTGFFITLFGLGLSLTNWLSLLVIMGCALIGFSYRIQVEEQVLTAQLGQRYQEYMQRTKRLIPFVF
ncbi:isoprenylcysteine carboxyl methyltransferase [Dictyobacter alpinus]|uniref:Isoprenylcysteine carboxyl methyltransferase n=1 Tax=Dictyobacter alpinus TaxID=2014873 RepID=A0A402BJI9_9CHLR|nr:isoprenylcysteine carboxylmethyltransferase family protein [Dictyobacter alpinus]GCE31512.1 isoprenylcysteine carboxyl methyltransferase [Dictyobacter alpinus]